MSTAASELKASAGRGRPRLGPSAYERALRLRLRREALGLSSDEVAASVGVPPDRYVYWERAWSDPPGC